MMRDAIESGQLERAHGLIARGYIVQDFELLDAFNNGDGELILNLIDHYGCSEPSMKAKFSPGPSETFGRALTHPDARMAIRMVVRARTVEQIGDAFRGAILKNRADVLDPLIKRLEAIESNQNKFKFAKASLLDFLLLDPPLRKKLRARMKKNRKVADELVRLGF